MLLAINVTSVSIAVALDDAPGQESLNADEQLRAACAEVNAQLDPAEQLKLEAAQKAWEKYRVLACEAVAITIDAKRSQKSIERYSADLAWSRVSHLRRMTELRDLKGSESDFRDADETINKVYKREIGMRERREPREALRNAQRAWIVYRDAATESESAVCPNPASAALYIKTELTYERSRNIRWRAALRYSIGPPDLETELYLAQLLSDKAEVRQKAIDFLAIDADKSLPLPMTEISTLPMSVSPYFQRLGAAAIPSLLDATDTSNHAMDQMPVFLAATGPAIVPELIARISSTNAVASQMSIAALARLSAHAKDAVPSLIEVIKAPDVDQAGHYGRKALAVQALLAIAPDNPDFIKALVDVYVASPKNDERFDKALRKLGRAASAALPTMIARAQGPDGSSSAAYCIDGLITSEDTALIPPLIEGLIDPAGKHSLGFSRALAKMGEPAVPPLKKLLQDNDDMKVQRAAETLAMMKYPPDDFVDTLIALSQKRDAAEAIFFLGLVSKFGEAAKPAIPSLLNLYDSGRPDVRMAALRSLHAIAPDLEIVKKNWQSEPYVIDPYYDAGCYGSLEPTEMMKQYAIEADFNNDGVMDVAISAGGFGKGGGGWNLYLGVSPRKYKRVRGLEAPLQMNLYTKENDKGIGYLGFYWYSSGRTGTELLNRITMEGIEQVGAVDVEWDANGTKIPVDENEQLPAPKGYVESRLVGKVIDKEFLLSQ